MNKLLLALPLALVVLISGCSIPGLPDFGGGGVKSQYENDVVIIKDQSVFPQSVKASQEITLVTYIQNLGERIKIDADVNLYDTCGVFKETKVSKPSGCSGVGCKVSLQPQEVKEINWKLIPDESKVKVPIAACKLKVSVSYPYKTDSQTELYFIEANEGQRQQEQGTFREKSSAAQKSEGPVVAYIEPDKNVRQPIFSNAKDFGVSLYVENKGSGFLQEIKTIDKAEVTAQVLLTTLSNCWTTGFAAADIKLINKKSPPQACKLTVPTTITSEKTARIESSIDYVYQFRKESQVTIEPA